MRREDTDLHKLSPYLPAVIWAVTVLGIGSLHNIPTPSVNFPIDKVGHFGMYGLLGALTAYGWHRSGRRIILAVPLALACSIGAIDEVHQRYVYGRSSDVRDFAADVAGIATAFYIVTRCTSSHRTETQ